MTPTLESTTEAAPPNFARPAGDRLDVAFYQPRATPLYASTGSPSGGAEAQIHMVARALAARGWRVGVIVNPSARLPAARDGVRVIPRRDPVRVPGVGMIATAALRSAALARLPADVVVKRVAGFDTALVALAARLGRKRFVYSSANVVDFDYSQLSSRLGVALFEWGVRRADRIVVQTREQETLCRERFGRDPVVISSIAEPAPPRSAEPTAFLWVGRLVTYKRPLEFVELARALPQARFRMIAVITGDHDAALRAELERADRELENLTLEPPRSREEVGELIASAVAVVNTAEYEGMPNVLLEAWSRGVPALSLNHDPDGVIASEGLGGFAGGSRERLASLAAELWASRTDQAELGERCRAYVAHAHSEDAVAERWERALGLARGGEG